VARKAQAQGESIITQRSQGACRPNGPGEGGGGLGQIKRMIQNIFDFSNLNEFQILAGLSKFVQGDLYGILTWGFFLKSSRLLNKI
jgi:hypothetical protein